MKLTLKNVRQHADLSLDLPDTGLVLLTGPSGTGKTTIFDAIEDALFDTGSDLQPWDGGAVSIELEIGPLRIAKRRNPGAWEVVHEGKTYVQDEAQAVVQSVLGMNADEFANCAYIKQEGAGSLLSLTPAEQLRFIQAISCKGFDPEKFKATLNTVINEMSNNIKDSEQKSDACVAQVQNLVSTQPYPPTQPTEPSAQPTKDDGLEGEIKSLNQTAQKISKQIGQDLEGQKRACEEALLTEQEKLKSLNDELSSLPPRATPELAALETQEKAKLRDCQNYYDLLNRAKAKASEATKRFEPATGENIIDWLSMCSDTMKAHLNEEKELLETNKSKLQELTMQASSLACPWCEQHVFIHQEKLHKGHPDQKELLRKIDNLKMAIKLNNSTIDIISADLSEVMATRDTLEKSKKELMDLKARLGVIPTKESLAEQFDAISSRQYQRTTALERAQTLDQEIRKSELTIRKTQNLLTSMGDPDPTATLDGHLTYVQDRLAQLSARLAEQQASTEAWSDYRKDLQSYSTIKATYDRIQENIIALINQQKVHDYNALALKNKLAAALRLSELTNIAATSAIEGVIEEINYNSQYFIDKFFPDTGTSIQLSSIATTKKGEERAKVGIELFHKGKKAKKLSNFSGGEKARIRLAFQLGLSKLFNSPIIVIDEGLAGCGEEDKQRCLEAIKEVADERLVLVIEHGAPTEVFDHIIEI